MRKVRSLAIAIAAVVASCGGSSTPSTATVTTPGSVQLALADMKLFDGKNVVAVIHADGTLELGGDKAARLTPDGKLVSLTGEVLLELRADGTIRVARTDQVLDVRVTDEGTITFRDKTYALDATGELVGGDPAAQTVKVEGATDARLRRTAMFVLAMSMAAHTVAPGPGAADPTTGPTGPTRIDKLGLVIDLPGKVDVLDTDVTGKEDLGADEVRIETSNEQLGTIGLRFLPGYRTANEATKTLKVAVSDATNLVVTTLPERGWILTWQYNDNKWYGVKVLRKLKGRWLIMDAGPDTPEAVDLAVAAFKSVRPL